jgi:phthiocerol/phenolphthiocerol synthesis type-I polyketide synthase E
MILGTAVNNDGAGKLGYYTPSVGGQRAVIEAALRASGVAARSIGHLEAHGTDVAVAMDEHSGYRTAGWSPWSSTTAELLRLPFAARDSHPDRVCGCRDRPARRRLHGRVSARSHVGKEPSRWSRLRQNGQ